MGQRPSSPLPTPPHSPEAVQFFGLLPPLPPSSLVTQSTPPRGCPVMPKKLPKRLNVAYFWARNRIVQKACMVRKCVYDYAVTEELETILLTQLRCFRQRRTLSIFLVFRGFSRVFFCLSIVLDAIWFEGSDGLAGILPAFPTVNRSHSNHRHPVMPHTLSTWVVVRNIPRELLSKLWMNVRPFVQSIFVNSNWY